MYQARSRTKTQAGPITFIKIVYFAALVLLSAVLLAGCGSNTTSTSAEQPAASTAVTITDSAGRTVEIPTAPQRIVSLAPANTEIVCAIGAQDKIVGITTFDDYPIGIKEVDAVSDFEGPNLESIAAVTPDLILATGGVQAETIAALEAIGAPVVVVDPKSAQEVIECIDMVGTALGHGQQAKKLVESLAKQLEEIKNKAAWLSEVDAPTAFVEIGQDPLFTVGNDTFIGDMITIAGGQNIVTESGYVPYSAEQVLKAQPLVYFATSGSGATPAAIDKRPGYKKLKAVKTGNVFILEENFVSRPGPRFIKGLKQIQNELLHAAGIG